ncbi:MAG TPA: hypothetical protein DEF47_12495 [Herpetosiphon sp.]|uniref:hypothetical protein n=1 Tax=Herpetosiphon sp. TaxID=71864 RepID=UPI0002D42B3A|nr:hypothetical protein [Herpetosiphon sp.]HBW50714.1 hypothetical protein [Herpetosiphon sp.]
MEFEIIDCNGTSWELFFGDSNWGKLFFQGQFIQNFDNEVDAIAYVENQTGSPIQSSQRVDNWRIQL